MYRDVVAQWRESNAPDVPPEPQPPILPEVITNPPPPPPDSADTGPVAAISCDGPPSPVSVGATVGHGVLAGAALGVIYALMMTSGWERSPGLHILPYLIFFGLLIALIGGTGTILVSLIGQRAAFDRELHLYRAVTDPAFTQAVNLQDEAYRRKQYRQTQRALDQLNWEQEYETWERTERAGEQATAARQQAAIAEYERAHHEYAELSGIRDAWDKETESVVKHSLVLASESGTPPTDAPAWLCAVAHQVHDTKVCIERCEDAGLPAHNVEHTTSRSVYVLNTPNGPTTLMFHHTPPQQLSDGPGFVVEYDSATGTYTPAPGTDHYLPTGAASRVIHVYTGHPVRTIPASGYAQIGSDAFLTSRDKVVETVHRVSR